MTIQELEDYLKNYKGPKNKHVVFAGDKNKTYEALKIEPYTDFMGSQGIKLSSII